MPSMHRASPPIAGYRLDLGEQLAAALHADGTVSLEGSEGRALDISPAQVEQLAALLALGSAGSGPLCVLVGVCAGAVRAELDETVARAEARAKEARR